MRQGAQVFKEYCEDEEDPSCPGGSRTVMRSPELKDNAALPPLFQARAGDKIYTALRADGEGFRGQHFSGPAPLPVGASFAALVDGARELLAVFVDNGYAISARVEGIKSRGSGGAFSIRLQGPATLWALQALTSRRSAVHNCYEAMALEAFFRASRREAKYTVSWSPSEIVTHWEMS
jgi:hypothetical protein